MPETDRYGTALIVSGPSGVGKTTVCRGLLAEATGLHLSVSCTTRPRRRGEKDGVDYRFLDRADFERRAAANDFIEHAEVHGNLYGTLRHEVDSRVAAGQDVVLAIDIQGARQVRERLKGSVVGRCAVFAFLAPPSLRELERRLRGRGTDSEAVVARRLATARVELAAWPEYDYLVVNDDVARAVATLRSILAAAHVSTRCVRIAAPNAPLSLFVE
jgi:guanylate kinase